MLIGVAIDALRELDLEFRVIARGHMARCTLHRGVRKDQRESRLRVIRNREGRRTPSLHGVAALTLSTIGAMRELAAMRIGLVAIRACIVRYRCLEVRALVTTLAGNLEMLADQRIVRLRVIECRGKVRLLPCERRVARIASLLELTLVRIAMAIRTTGEGQSCIANLAVRARRVTA